MAIIGGTPFSDTAFCGFGSIEIRPKRYSKILPYPTIIFRGELITFSMEGGYHIHHIQLVVSQLQGSQVFFFRGYGLKHPAQQYV